LKEKHMRKKLALTAFAVALAAGSMMVKPAAALTCPTGSHLLVCSTYSFCCPNNAFCICERGY
jgi:hypothetical protein